ncbi:MAG: hypothetical protein JNL39_03810 [Opitutaceae bacterium]|nr:hypothetical protein [Opitutaceae bacterium]
MKTSPGFPLSAARGLALAAALGLGATLARAQAVVAPAAPAATDGPTVLSPFQVSESARGYYSPNTMSGTRLNSRLEDLAASISVITKEQMADFALLDANDIFLYEAGTEGPGNFTSFEFDRNGYPVDSTTLEPGGANRVRGIGAANTARGGFETTGRVPLDAVNIDAVEISRGPNASLFGLGNAGGTVNVIPAAAQLARDRAQAQFRADSYEGFRSSVDVNRVLRKDTLALRASTVFQRDASPRKPSGTDTVRLNGMVRYRPFRRTTLGATFESYRIAGNRANVTMPRDTLTAWRAAGSPTYNNKSRQMRFNGTLTGGALGVATLPPYLFNTTGSGRTNSLVLVDRDGAITFWGQPEGVASLTPPNPGARNQGFVGGQANTNSPVELVYGLPSVGLFNDLSVTSRGTYDWTSINLAAMNHLNESTKTATATLEHIFVDDGRHLLGLELGFFREDSKKYRRDLAGGPTSQRAVGALYVDVNEFLPDGRANPNLLRPYIGLWIPTSYENPLLRETYRAQLAYRLDLRKEKGALRWLGMQQVSAYGEYKENIARRLSYKDAIVSSHPWIAAGAQRATTAGAITNNYFRFYVGDNVGQDVDYGPASFKWGAYPYRWGTVEAIGLNGAITTPANLVTETATLGPAAQAGAGGSNNRQILKTEGAILQSFLLNERVVTAFGVRQDRNHNRGGLPLAFLADGASIDQARFEQWAAGDWAMGEGVTRTASLVARPLRWLSLHAGKSDSFLPAEAATDLLQQPVSDPGGEGEDFGLSLNLLGGRLVARVNHYRTKQLRTRNGQSATLAARVRGIDFDTPNRATTPFFLIPQATGWVQRANPSWSAAQVSAEVARIAQLDPAFIAKQAGENLAETEDITARGEELEVFFAPSSVWSVKFNLTRQESINARVAPGITDYVRARMPVWLGIRDPETGRPWWTSDYDVTAGVRTAADYFRDAVEAPVKLAQAGEGKSRPQIRQYRANLLTSYRLAGLTDRRFLKNLQVGGAARWEDKGAIGYHGVQRLPTPITELDVNRPIFDRGNLYLDAFATYRTRLFANKVGATVQLNVRNVLEDGRLQAIKANPDGSPSVFRIVDPRQFILTVTFDL